MKTLIIDNYDSFTYNLYQYIGELGGNPVVFRNDAITIDQIKKDKYSHIVISPGPGDPTDPEYFGVCAQVIAELGPTTPLLGVCLGHQGIIAAFGGRIVRAPKPLHGKQSVIDHEGVGIFTGIENPLTGMRYHSLVGEKETLPQDLIVTATARNDGMIMGIQHTEFPIYGIQFHPESIGTQEGKKLLHNFLNIKTGPAPGFRPVSAPSTSFQSALSGALPRRQAGLPPVSPVFTKLKDRQDLTRQEAGEMLEMLLSAQIADEKKGEMLRQLSYKGETVEEIVGFIRGMRERMVRIDFDGFALDTCGTGGDGKGTLNISTATALVVAGSGVAVAKHGNRSATSKSGSADVLEALGVNIMMDHKTAHHALKNIGITFLFAPLYHPAMKVLGPIRKSLGVPTIFNMLGPFLNPVGVQHQLIGVPTIAKAQKLIEVGKMLGYKRLFIVSSQDGLDEVSIAAPTTVFALQDGVIDRFEIDPKKFGLQGSVDEISGGDPSLNAKRLKELIEGKESAYANAVILNSAVALLAAEDVASIAGGIDKARESIKQGNAKKKLEELVRISRSL